LNLAKTLGSRRHKALIALLIERREAAGMTQTQLAGRLGEYQSFVARLESGQRRVDVVERTGGGAGVRCGEGPGGGEEGVRRLELGLSLAIGKMIASRSAYSTRSPSQPFKSVKNNEFRVLRT
jgi:hypothetical protein